MKSLLQFAVVVLFTFEMGNCINTIFPEEFSSFMNLVLSTIPAVKKATDSRIGFGFRNGRNSDLQIVFELGPQQYTEALGAARNYDNKREVNLKDAPKSVRSRSQSKSKQKLSKQFKKSRKFVSPKVQAQQQQQQQPKNESRVKKSTILDEESFRQLQSLYKSLS